MTYIYVYLQRTHIHQIYCQSFICFFFFWDCRCIKYGWSYPSPLTSTLKDSIYILSFHLTPVYVHWHQLVLGRGSEKRREGWRKGGEERERERGKQREREENIELFNASYSTNTTAINIISASKWPWASLSEIDSQERISRLWDMHMLNCIMYSPIFSRLVVPIMLHSAVHEGLYPYIFASTWYNFTV